MNIAGVVVLYNPEEEILENVQTYLSFLKKLYVMDNSTKEHDFKEKLEILDKKIEHISMGGNKGIAKALKDATEKAIEDGYDYILTMDQDSKYPTEDFKIIEDFVRKNDMSNIGMLTINYTGSKFETNNKGKDYFENIEINISSGMIIVLEKYKQIEGFNEDLFIDLVDYDVCKQMEKMNFDIILFNNIILNHKLGEQEERRFLWMKRTKPWHSALRYYYLFRNYYYLKKYKNRIIGISGTDLNNYAQLKNIIYLTVFSKHRFKTFKMIMQGIHDGKRGILGPYENRKKK